MFSAVDGFRFTSTDSYVAIYTTSGNTSTGQSVAMTDDGNVYIGGQDTDANPDIPVIYSDMTGYITQQVAIKEDANTNPIMARSLDVDSTGNIVIAGQTYIAGSVNDALVMKLYPNLQPVWSSYVTTTVNKNDAYFSGAIDNSDNIYVSGLVNSANSIVTKYDTSGTILFSKQLANVTTITKIETDNSDNYYTMGIETSNASYDKLALQKWDSNGTTVWGKLYSDIPYSVSYANLTVDSTGNSVFATHDVDAPNGLSKTSFVKLYANGDQAWAQQCYKTGNSAYIVPIGPLATDGSNIYAITDPDSGVGNLVIIKTDSSGTKVWERTLSSSVNYPTTPQQMVWANGYISIVGGTGNSTGGISLVKLKDDGTGLGTYGNYTYSDTNKVTLTSTTVSITTLPDNSSSYTPNSITGSFTSNVNVFSSSVTYL